MRDDRSSIWERYRNFLRRRTADDVADELRFHLQMRADEAREAGLSEPEARDAALERFGEYSTVEAEMLRLGAARERRRGRLEWIADMRQDAVFALRSLRRAPSFALTAIATLAIAIGANTAIYSVVHALLFAPLPYANPERLVSLWGGSLGELVALEPRLHSMADIAAYGGIDANFDDGADAERLSGATVTPNFFSLLGVRPLLGRTFSADESDRGKTNVVILSEGFWRRRFAGDRGVIGRRVQLDGAPVTVVGVMPAEFAFPSTTEAFWRPIEIDRGNHAGLWTRYGLALIGRLRPGTTVDAASREIRPVAVALRHANPVWDPGPQYGVNATVQSLLESLVGETRPLLLLLSGCALLVLLIACVNVANLLLARASARERELAVRAALGGGRGRLIRQLLTESIVIATAGAVVGLAFAGAGVRWLMSAMPDGVPRASEIGMSGAALGFTAALAVLTGIAFGALPAFRATRGRASGDVARAGRTGFGAGHQRVSSMLVISEVALAVLVVIGAELLVRSFRELRRIDPGFATTRLVALRVTPSRGTYATPSRTDNFYDAVLQRTAALPGVRSVGVVNRLPLAQPARGVALRVEGKYEDEKQTLPFVNRLDVITPRYLATMGIAVRRGRDFTNDDRDGNEPVAIVSQSTAKMLWPDGDPIGKRVGYPYRSPWIRVIGIVPDVKSDSLRDTTGSAIYVPFLQRPRDQRGNASSDFTVIAKTSGDPLLTGRALRAIIADVDRGVPVSQMQTMEQVVAQSVSNAQFAMSLVSAFAVVALLLGAVGIYGVMTYVVSQRMQELGVRAALGATSADILGMVVRRAAILAGSGAVVGMAGALLAVRPLRALLYGVSTTDPLTYVSVPLLFVGVALVASAGPGRRASRVSPTSVLRAD